MQRDMTHQCRADGVDGVRRGHPLGREEVGEVNVDVEERLVEKKSGGLAAQRLKRRQQNLELCRRLLRVSMHNYISCLDKIKFITEDYFPKHTHMLQTN